MRRPRHRRTATRRLVAVLLLVTAVAACGTSTVSPSVSPSASGAVLSSPTVAVAPAPSSAPASPAVSFAPPSALPSQPAPTATDGLASELVEPGRLIACIDFPTPLMAEIDDQGNQIGVNVDIARALAERLGLEAEVRDVVFETLIDAIAGAECDISVSGQIITRSRLQRIAMVPYLQGVQHVVVQAGNPSNIQTLRDLCGRRLAVQRGTTHVDLVVGQGDHAGAGLNQDCRSIGEPDVELLQFAEPDEAVDALAAGDADAYIGNDFVIVERSGEFELSADLPPIRLGIGVGRDRHALAAAIASGLGAMISDGAYLGILETYDVVHLGLTE
jgi:polar amino acid transport system substrate-binding protein